MEEAKINQKKIVSITQEELRESQEDLAKLMKASDFQAILKILKYLKTVSISQEIIERTDFERTLSEIQRMNSAKLSSDKKADHMEVLKIVLQIKLNLKKISGQKIPKTQNEDKEEIKN